MFRLKTGLFENYLLYLEDNRVVESAFCDDYFGGVIVDYHDAVAAGFRFYQRFNITSSFIAFDRAFSATVASLTAEASDELSFITLLRVSAASSWAEFLLSLAEAK